MQGCAVPSASWAPTSTGVLIEIVGQRGFFREVSPPAESSLRRAYDEMVQESRLECPPSLVFVDSLGGAGGLFLGDLILVGVADAEGIARRVLPRVVPRARFWEALPPLVMVVTEKIIAHELGHALDAEGLLDAPFRDPEARADYAAGWLDKVRGRDRGLGRAIFKAIGCEGLLCTHPSPAGRAHAYVTGRQQASRWMRDELEVVPLT